MDKRMSHKETCEEETEMVGKPERCRVSGT